VEKLKQQLSDLISRLESAADLRRELASLVSVYPFSEYEYVIAHLLAASKLTLDEYHGLRRDYIDRNLYLYLFEISAPRGFGEAWAHGHLKELVPAFQRPSKELDPEYSGQYDFLLPPAIRVEVKASRAVDFDSDEPLYIKALSSDSRKRFDMNFQQIKPACCDVFVWIAAWRDVIRHWVMPSYVVEHHRYFSPAQHRGNVGEGQLHLTHDNIREFEPYLVKSTQIEDAVRRAFEEDKLLRRRGPAQPPVSGKAFP
jgi:hypothetical protein